MDTLPAAIIFDMDDTLVATSALWREAEDRLLGEIGHRWSSELAIQYKGMNALDVAATIHRLLRPALPVKSCQEIMRNALFRSFEKGVPKPMPGAVPFVRTLAGIFPMALASGSPLPLIKLALERMELQGSFDVLLSSESVTRGKPFPDIFLAAAKALGAEPARCLVFEDSLIGVRAALASGMACFGIPSSSFTEITQLATRTFASLSEVTVEDVKSALRLVPTKFAGLRHHSRGNPDFY
jgi:HAD superfamily hydrolase (TIGR01509 family)